ncbi:DUF952 domain-containing protein [Sphingomonas xinjiangensis]|uniref:Uncharacterized protein (DUF952 family) n=1 Tax=Sphingomonas xinjiangensis TaxID=643568 RepID=A0A840YAG3_9SPHN|nr:DUF952 domain-containing protein [Sphingomonas xinjiangensis]MBB5709285.1 uncharacterized protein (DUF952 family) [Sphingomonas xinjiangensis]
MPDKIAYKVLTADQMITLEHERVFQGAPVDLQDGYIHLSTAEQLDETITKHFAGQSDLWLVAVDLDAQVEAVRWEPSRGGALFPHLYGALSLDTVLAYSELNYEPDGSLRLPVTG